MSNNQDQTSQNPDLQPDSNIEITHQFPAQKTERKQEIKDIFEEGLAFEPQNVSTTPEPKQEPKTSSSVKTPVTRSPRDIPQEPPQIETDNLRKPETVDTDGLGSLQLKGFSQNQNKSTQETSLPAQPPHKKSILGLIIGTIIALLVLGGGGYTYFTFFTKKTITLKLNTEDAVVKIDSKDYSSEIRNQVLEIKLSGDVHKFEISKDNYFTYKKSIDLSKLQNNNLEVDLRSYPIAQQLMKYTADYLRAYFVSDLLYYRSNQGKTLYSITLNSDGSQEDFQRLSPDIMVSINNLVWSPRFDSTIIQIPADKTKGTVFAEGGTSGTKTFIYFDYKNVQYIGSNILDIKYSQDGKSIYYNTTGGLLLKSLIENISESQQLLNTKKALLENPKIVISNTGNYLALIPQSTNYEDNQIYLFDITSKELTELITDGSQFDARFSTNDSNLLFVTYSESGPVLNAVNIQSKDIFDLNIQTSIENTVWLDDENILFSKYNKSSNSYEVNKRGMDSDSNASYRFDSAKTLEIKNILFNPDNNILYFLNNSLIYYLKLDDGRY
ncbi:MAG: hypothetical protein ABH837_02630 [bacterium]